MQGMNKTMKIQTFYQTSLLFRILLFEFYPSSTSHIHYYNSMGAGTPTTEGLVKEIISVIQASDLGWTLKRAVQDELSKSFVNLKDIKRLVPVNKPLIEVGTWLCRF